jgi:DNA repair exonuclease SbcCD nuclease subunit
MRIAAIGDAHLGRSYYPFTAESGVNQREWDFERSFEAAVELALAEQPDLIVWLGDVFDHPRPTYRSFRVVQRALTRIRDHGLRAVIITGNHDTPRLPGTGSPYSVLADSFPEMSFAHRLQYERFEFPGLAVHAVPQMLTVEATLDALAEADRTRSLDRVNLLLTHPRITQVEPATTTSTPRSPTASGMPARPTRSTSATTPTSPRASWSSTPTPVRSSTSRSRGSDR